ncbi:MAG: AMP-binding protein [Sphaerochaetaceae bacterium]|nr:AMP-binding protein [Sphaerochaetaceae bacterium]
MITIKEYTVTSILDESAVRFANLQAVATWREKGSEMTYATLKARSQSVARYLVSIGIEKDDKVAILGESSHNWALSYFSINRAGAIAVPILPNFSKHEVKDILTHSDSKVVIVNAKHADKVMDLGLDVIRMEDMFHIHKDSLSLYDGKNFKDLSGYDTKGTILSENDKKVLASRRPKEEDLASIIYTSGTTGTPKGVMLTNKNICFNAYECSFPFIKIHSGWRALSILPMSHVYEFTIGLILLILNGIQITYLGKAPSTDSLLPAMKEVQPEVMLSVPLLIEKIYRRALLPKFKEGTKLGKFAKNRLTAPIVYKIIGKKVKTIFGGRLKFFGVGGAAFDSEAEAFFHRIKFPYALGYGLTETSPLIAGCGPKDQVPCTIGHVLDSLSVKLDPETREIMVKGPSVMRGYYKNQALTEEVFTEDGYFRTGDIGEFSKDGRLALKGRIKTMILGPAGENIFPESIEFLINAEEDVVESLVIADEHGQLLAMIRLDIRALKRKGIVAVGEIENYLSQIKDRVNEKLSSFSKIRTVEIQNEPFERTPSEKIKRFLYQRKKTNK